MSETFKVLYVCFPETEKRQELLFRGGDLKAVSVTYEFLMKNGAVVTQFDGFEDWEIKLLTDSKTPSGDSLVRPKCCCKGDSESNC
jgi:hypothetical protein